MGLAKTGTILLWIHFLLVYLPYLAPFPMTPQLVPSPCYFDLLRQHKCSRPLVSISKRWSVWSLCRLNKHNGRRVVQQWDNNSFVRAVVPAHGHTLTAGGCWPHRSALLCPALTFSSLSPFDFLDLSVFALLTLRRRASLNQPPTPHITSGSVPLGRHTHIPIVSITGCLI